MALAKMPVQKSAGKRQNSAAKVRKSAATLQSIA
jgi:hypothetical protein